MIKLKLAGIKRIMTTFGKNEDFIFEIIHDIKAPVIGIDYALKNVERDDFLDEIYKINRHNLNYIENMLNLYSLSKGKYCPKIELLNLNKIVKEEIGILNFLIEEKNLRIIISTDKADELIIATDKYLIRQIILNLLTNAVKYTPYGSSIHIIFENIEGCFNICFKNPYNKNEIKKCSSKMGLEIVKKKLKALKGKLRTTKTDDTVCYTICLKCL